MNGQSQTQSQQQRLCQLQLGVKRLPNHQHVRNVINQSSREQIMTKWIYVDKQRPKRGLPYKSRWRPCLAKTNEWRIFFKWMVNLLWTVYVIEDPRRLTKRFSFIVFVIISYHPIITLSKMSWTPKSTASSQASKSKSVSEAAICPCRHSSTSRVSSR